MRKSIMKSMRNAMRKVKSVTKSVTKSKRKVTRRTKRHVMRGGDYKISIVDEVDLVPIMNKKSKDLSVSVPGFGTISMEEYHEYMEDLDRHGSAQM